MTRIVIASKNPVARSPFARWKLRKAAANSCGERLSAAAEVMLSCSRSSLVRFLPETFHSRSSRTASAERGDTAVQSAGVTHPNLPRYSWNEQWSLRWGWTSSRYMESVRFCSENLKLFHSYLSWSHYFITKNRDAFICLGSVPFSCHSSKFSDFAAGFHVLSPVNTALKIVSVRMYFYFILNRNLLRSGVQPQQGTSCQLVKIN